MSYRDGYFTDLFLTISVRLGLLAGIICITAVILSGCTREPDRDPFPRKSLGNGAVERLPLEGGEATQTRNRFPQGGCDEKSDSSLKEPLG